MKRVTANPMDRYDPKKHEYILLLHRKHRKSMLFVSATGEFKMLPSSPADATVFGRELGRFNQNDRLRTLELLGYELIALSKQQMESVAGHALLCSSISEHIDGLLSNFPEEQATAQEQGLTVIEP